MQFQDYEYFQTSLQRMRQARVLYQREDAYALSMYCSGLAVECLLRAFRWRMDRSFHGRHDLDELLKSCGIMQEVDKYIQRKGQNEPARSFVNSLRGAMNDVVVLWDNCLRFMSEERLKTYLRDKGKVQKVKGDACKKNSYDLLEAAQIVLDRGQLLWSLAKK